MSKLFLKSRQLKQQQLTFWCAVILTNVRRLFPPTEQFVKRRRSLSVLFRPNVELGKTRPKSLPASKPLSRMCHGFTMAEVIVAKRYESCQAS